ncbi:MAG TPA: beta-ketoacyl-ACP synthase II [Thermodesulfovibrionales bacterium]|nr:beta-ketoacyl-ACP synthase II [Thermodesulfovibrionales bacterium]
MNRAVVTGIGAVTPLGNSFIQSWEAAKAGASGIGGITKLDASNLSWKIAGELKGFDATSYLSPRETNRLDPFVHYAVAASLMAMKDAGLAFPESSPITYNRFPKAAGVIVGSSRGGITTLEREWVRMLRGSSRISPYTMPSSTVSMAASSVAQKLGMRGYCLGISNACASGTNAVGEAYSLIKNASLDVVVAGGAEAPLCRTCLEGYGVAGALSGRQCPQESSEGMSRPFDLNRDGFVLSEGACVLVLENYESAMKRGANIYGEIIGYGNTTDAFHITKPDPKGEAAAILAALRDAAISPDAVDHINTHGTATQIGDIAEARALTMVFRERTSSVPATAVKSMTGHMLAASGAFETAITLMAMKEGLIPPSINLDEQDPACNISVVTEPMRADITVAITNSFGFGGVNAVLALRRI